MSQPSFKDLLSKTEQQSLKNLSKSTTKTKTQTICSNKINHTPTDAQLFSQAMQGVTPLKAKKVVHLQVKKSDENAAFRRAAAQGSEESFGANLSDMQALLNPVAGEAYLSYKNPTLQNKVFEQLKQGKIRWYDAVDLHGSDIEDARQAVQQIVHNASENGETVIKIIHGKGKNAIIKTCVNGWLRQMPNVMAFVSAPANDGGNGAVLVLLKKKQVTR